jgi:hypothetical protein
VQVEHAGVGDEEQDDERPERDLDRRLDASERAQREEEARCGRGEGGVQMPHA